MKRSISYLFFAGILVLFQFCEQETDPKLPEVTTTEVTEVGQFTATSGGKVASDGEATVIVRGVCWSSTTLPTIEDDKTEDGSGKGNFISSMTGLTNGTNYLVRAYAINKVGVAYGNQIEFKTSPTPTIPTVTTTIASNITLSSASSGGNVTSDGNSPVTARGVCWGTSTGPTINDNKTSDGTGEGEFASTLTSLSVGTTYYVRAYATNAIGTAYGNEISFSPNSITTTIYAAKDASIFDTQAGGSANSNYGAGGSQLLQVGYANVSGVYARTLVMFDLSAIPSNATIENVELQFTMGNSGVASSYSLNVHKLSQQWTEGATSFCTYNAACNTQGAVIAGGGADVTWNETSYSGTNANPWTTTGGSFSSTVSATKAAVGNSPASTYSFISTELRDDVQSWVSNSAVNFGWILKTDFISTSSSMTRFYSREGATESGNTSTAPRLVITYR
jgi:hypothetical protein